MNTSVSVKIHLIMLYTLSLNPTSECDTTKSLTKSNGHKTRIPLPVVLSCTPKIAEKGGQSRRDHKWRMEIRERKRERETAAESDRFKRESNVQETLEST